MNSGLLFYWLSWILWIIVTFFMQKSKIRTIVACWLLLLILCSNLYVSINTFQLSASYLILLAGALILHTRIPRMAFHVFGSFTVMIGFASMLIWENHTPIKLFFPSLPIISCILFVLITFITTGLWSRLACLSLGMAGGEFVYSIITSRYLITDVVGGNEFFDLILVVTVAIISQELLLKLKQKVAQKLQNSKARSNPKFRKQAQ